MDRRRWRLLTACFVMALAAALVACGDDAADPGGETSASAASSAAAPDTAADATVGAAQPTAAATEVTGSLKIASGTEIKPGTEALIQAYQAARPGVDVTTSYALETQYNTQIKAQLTGSNGPDVLIVLPGSGNATSAGQLSRAGLLADLSGEPWVGDINPSQLPEVTFEGRTYLYPLGYDPMGIVYDRKVWEANGMTVPQTWSELLASCAAWREKGLEPIAVGMKESFVPQFITYALIASTVYRTTPDFDARQAAGEATFADSGWREALEKYVALEKAGCFHEGYQGSGYDEMLNMVTTGKAAMTVTVSASMGAMRESNPDAEITMAPFPTTDEPQDNWVAAGVFAGFAMSENAQHPEVARDFLRFVNTPEMAAKFQAAAGAVPPGDDPDAPGLDAVVAVIQDGRTGPYPDHFWPNADVQATHNAVIQQLFTGQASIDDALRQLDEAYAEGA